MDNYTATTMDSLPKGDLLEIIEALNDKMQERPSMGESFAKVLDKWDPKMAKSVREKGMPSHIVVGKNLYDVFQEYLSPYCLVTKAQSFLNAPNLLFLSWHDPRKLWAGINSEDFKLPE